MYALMGSFQGKTQGKNLMDRGQNDINGYPLKASCKEDLNIRQSVFAAGVSLVLLCFYPAHAYWLVSLISIRLFLR